MSFTLKYTTRSLRQQHYIRRWRHALSSYSIAPICNTPAEWVIDGDLLLNAGRTAGAIVWKYACEALHARWLEKSVFTFQLIYGKGQNPFITSINSMEEGINIFQRNKGNWVEQRHVRLMVSNLWSETPPLQGIMPHQSVIWHRFPDVRFRADRANIVSAIKDDCHTQHSYWILK